MIVPAPYRLLALAIAAAALTAAGFGAGYKLRALTADRDIAALQAEHSQAKLNAAEDSKKKLQDAVAAERGLRDDIERTANAERQRAEAAAVAAADLASERDGLRNDIRRRAAARACGASTAPATAGGSTAEGASPLVPGSDDIGAMLNEGATALAILAPALEQSDAGHRACAAIYEQARARLKRIGEAGRTLNP